MYETTPRGPRGRSGQYMTGAQIALVSGDARELRVVSRYLEEEGIPCRAYLSGRELLAALDRGQPVDVVVLGDQLGDIGESAFLAQMRRLRRSPVLLFLGECRHEEVQAAGLRTDGTGYLARQKSLRELVLRLRRAVGDNACEVERMCAQLYEEWKIPQPDINCDYLTKALCIACSTTEKLAVRKEILQAVAEQSQVTVAAVDSGLRRLIEGLETRSPEAWMHYKQEHELEGQRVSTGKLIRVMQGGFYQWKHA